jgi:tetratricopeptide (TPR) repeat protein
VALPYVLITVLTAAMLQGVPINRSKIKIINTGAPVLTGPDAKTHFDAGPSVGDMLNYHYFPSIKYYAAGRYVEAAFDFTYVIDRPHYMEGNLKRDEYLSTAYYLRGMVYVYHATGVGRRALAQQDFEAAIKHNPNNHLAYLELSRVYSSLGFKDEATSVLRRLLESVPDKQIIKEAQDELKKLTQPQLAPNQ